MSLENLEGYTLVGLEERPKIPPYFWARAALAPKPPKTYVVDGLFEPGGVYVAVGQPGAKKTFAMMHMCTCVAAGRTWLNREVERKPVLFVDEESGRDRFERRLAGIMRRLGAPDDLPFAYTCLLRLDLRHDENRLKDLIVEVGAGLAIIDALADIMPGADENSTKDTQPIFQSLRNVAETTKSAVIVIHHCGKSGGYRGSSAILGAVDGMLLIESKPQSTAIEFETIKNRDGEPQRFSAICSFQDDGFNMIPAAETTERVELLPKSAEYVLRILKERGQMSLPDIAANADVCTAEAARKAVYLLASQRKIYRVNSEERGQGVSAIYALV
ncbi:MAG: AAA family ATPase [Anaerolineae bacterium]|nr:AAA family ATPase [Anaerolineae bacterium]